MGTAVRRTCFHAFVTTVPANAFVDGQLAGNAFAVVAVALLLVGVVGSVTPLVPGSAASLAGVYVYWWSTNFTTPSPLLVVAFTLVGGVALAANLFAGAVSAKVGGASTRTAALAAVAGLVLLLVTGPVGVVVGVGVAVFADALYRTRSVRRGLRVSAYSMVGLLASALVQFVVTTSLLVAFLLAVLL